MTAIPDVPKRKVFRITFGQRYRSETHPAGDWIHPDGYVVIVADNELAARRKADKVFGPEGWSMIYDHLDVERGRFNPENKHYKDGVLAVYFA
jgi:hypothetical protein